MWTLIFYTHSHFHTSIFYQLINVNAPQPDAYGEYLHSLQDSRHDAQSIQWGYGFQIGDIEKASPRRVLKLHSSINWLVSIFNGATSEGRICS